MARRLPLGPALAVPVVWRTPAYRACAVSLFLVGLAISSGLPLVTLFLIRDLHIGASVAGLFFLTALAGPVVSVATGRLSDFLPSRAPLIRGSALWLAAGWALMAVAREPWLAYAVGLVFFCVIGTLSAQVFAALRDVLAREGERREATVTSTIRTAYSLGWIIGPVVGAWLAGALDVRAAFVATAALYLASLLPLWRIDAPTRGHDTGGATADRRPFARANLPLVLFALVCVLVLSGDAIKLAYLPVYLVGGLKQNVAVFGSLLSVSAIVELVVMPLTGVLADRFGLARVITGGVVIGALDYGILAGSTALWQLYVVQVLHVAVIAALLGLGVTYAQRLSRDRAGLASSVFFGAQGLSTPLGGLLGSYGVRLLGVPHVFALPSLLCVLSVGVLVAVHRQFVREQPLSTPRGGAAGAGPLKTQ